MLWILLLTQPKRGTCDPPPFRRQVKLFMEAAMADMLAEAHRLCKIPKGWHTQRQDWVSAVVVRMFGKWIGLPCLLFQVFGVIGIHATVTSILLFGILHCDMVPSQQAWTDAKHSMVPICDRECMERFCWAAIIFVELPVELILSVFECNAWPLLGVIPFAEAVTCAEADVLLAVVSLESWTCPPVCNHPCNRVSMVICLFGAVFVLWFGGVIFMGALYCAFWCRLQWPQLYNGCYIAGVGSGVLGEGQCHFRFLFLILLLARNMKKHIFRDAFLCAQNSTQKLQVIFSSPVLNVAKYHG